MFERTNLLVSMSQRWRYTNVHINSLELKAALLAIRHIFHSSNCRNSRVALFIDSIAYLGAVGKGRLSSVNLNTGCRRLAASLLTSNIVLSKFLRTMLEVIEPLGADCTKSADAPSRHAPRRLAAS